MKPCDPTQIDESLHENIAHGTENFPYQFLVSEYGGEMNDSFPWHWHREIEVVYVERGEAHCLIGNARMVLKPGDGLVINSGVIHSYEAPSGADMPTLLFMPEFIAPEGCALHRQFVVPMLTSGLTLVRLCREVPWQRRVLDETASFGPIATSGSPTAALDAHATLCRLWAILFAHIGELANPAGADTAMLTQARLRAMITYIEAEYGEKICLADIARAAIISVSEALRCFRDGVHATPIEYLNRYRLNQACSRLGSTALTVTEIAIESGFSSAAYFDRAFQKAFHLRPTEYRKKKKDAGEAS